MSSKSVKFKINTQRFKKTLDNGTTTTTDNDTFNLCAFGSERRGLLSRFDFEQAQLRGLTLLAVPSIWLYWDKAREINGVASGATSTIGDRCWEWDWRRYQWCHVHDLIYLSEISEIMTLPWCHLLIITEVKFREINERCQWCHVHDSIFIEAELRELDERGQWCHVHNFIYWDEVSRD